MCGIIGSFNINKFQKLINLNSSRGNFSHSLTCIDYNTLKINKLIRKFDKFDITVSNKQTEYYLGHIQSPTNGLIKDKKRIHPVKLGSNYLYHNGILKTQEIEKLNYNYNQKIKWDSKLILLHIIQTDNLAKALSELDGSFACVLLTNNELYTFRNQSSILYYDKNLNISSTKFNNSIELPINKIFKFDFKNNKLIHIDSFKNKNSPYYFV